jgi:hypothetical protein
MSTQLLIIDKSVETETVAHTLKKITAILKIQMIYWKFDPKICNSFHYTGKIIINTLFLTDYYKQVVKLLFITLTAEALRRTFSS